MIRKTLATTKAATFCVHLPHSDPAKQGLPTPTGTGFMVSEDGWFVTAAHVVCDANHVVRPEADIEDARLEKAGPPEEGVVSYLEWPTLDWIDTDSDIALLKVDFKRNSSKTGLKGHTSFPHLSISTRPLEEGEPLYAFGYPLGQSEVHEEGSLAVGITTISPRVTSAIVASTVESYGLVAMHGEPTSYVLDKALNYGNSGGPIVASETGHVHAVCTRFQPVMIPQEHLADPEGNPIGIVIPSLYGVVSSLSRPSVLEELRRRGVDAESH